MPGVASPSKKHSLVISSWVEREEPSWGSTWRSERHTHSGHMDSQANGNMAGQMKPPSNDALVSGQLKCSIASELQEMYASTGQNNPSCPDYECMDSGFPAPS